MKTSPTLERKRMTKAGCRGLPALAVCLLPLIGAAPAAATPRTLPFTYPYHTMPAGTAEVEQYVDIIPTRVAREKPDGTLEGVMGSRYVLQTELEYGLTDRLEGAFYMLFRQAASSDNAALRFAGVKQRLRYRLATEEEWPVGVGVYFEVAELVDEIEVEEKIIVGRRFGRLQVLANLWLEQERELGHDETELIYNPTVGATWEISPSLVTGLEYWMRGQWGDADEGGTAARTQHYLGPTLLLQGKTLWLSLGAYLGLHSLGHGFEVDQPYGPLWVRALLGVDL